MPTKSYVITVPGKSTSSGDVYSRTTDHKALQDSLNELFSRIDRAGETVIGVHPITADDSPTP